MDHASWSFSLMPGGLDKTLHVLAATPNEAATAVLLPALDSPHVSIQEGALRALAERRSLAAQREIVARWPGLSARWKAIVAEKPGRLSSALRDAILGDDEALCASACDAALALREYELMPALIKTATGQPSARADLATHTLLRLAQSLCDDVAQPSDWQGRRDPQLYRVQVVSALELAVERFGDHGRKEVVEAFLMLASRENSTLKRILRQPLDRCHRAIIECLMHSTRPAVMRLLLNFFDDSRAPRAAMGALARRDDDAFVAALLRRIGFEPSAGAKANLRRMTKLDWLEQAPARLAVMEEPAQHAAVQLAMVAGIGRDHALAVVRFLVLQGKPAGRRAAAVALAEFTGAEANQLALRALDDPDPHVQAAALAQLRHRGLPGSMARLVEALDNPHEVLRSTARECLSEFNFARYLASFDAMDEEVRRSTGQLVRKVEPAAARLVVEELQAPTRSRKLRGIEVAQAMRLCAAVEAELHALLADEDHMIRAAAAGALGQCRSVQAREALREALLDSSVAVHNAAEAALEQIASDRRPKTGPIDLAAIQLGDTGPILSGA
jgi:HEAT repeat protein